MAFKIINLPIKDAAKAQQRRNVEQLKILVNQYVKVNRDECLKKIKQDQRLEQW